MWFAVFLGNEMRHVSCTVWGINYAAHILTAHDNPSAPHWLMHLRGLPAEAATRNLSSITG